MIGPLGVTILGSGSGDHQNEIKAVDTSSSLTIAGSVAVIDTTTGNEYLEIDGAVIDGLVFVTMPGAGATVDINNGAGYLTTEIKGIFGAIMDGSSPSINVSTARATAAWNSTWAHMLSVPLVAGAPSGISSRMSRSMAVRIRFSARSCSISRRFSLREPMRSISRLNSIPSRQTSGKSSPSSPYPQGKTDLYRYRPDFLKLRNLCPTMTVTMDLTASGATESSGSAPQLEGCASLGTLRIYPRSHALRGNGLRAAPRRLTDIVPLRGVFERKPGS